MATKRKRKKRPTPSEGRIDAMEFFESLYGPVTLGGMLWSFRMCDEVSQAEFARRLYPWDVTTVFPFVMRSLRMLLIDDAREVRSAYPRAARGRIAEKNAYSNISAYV